MCGEIRRHYGRFDLGCGRPRIEIVRASIAAAVFILRRLSSRGGNPPSKKVECLLRLPSIFGIEKSLMQKKGGRGSSPPAHSQFRLLPPLLTSQTTKEVRYQELRVRRRSSTPDCVKYIMNMKYAECNMQRDGPAGRLGLNQCLIDWKNPLP